MTRREQKQEAYEDALFALLMEDVIEELIGEESRTPKNGGAK